MYRTVTEEEGNLLMIIFFGSLLLAYILVKIVDKRVSDRFKAIYIKAFLSIFMVIFTLSIIFYIFISISIHESAKDNFWAISGAIFSLIFGSFGAFMGTFGSVKPTKPEKYLLKQSNYDDFSRYLKNRITLLEYKNECNEENIKVYRKEIKKIVEIEEEK